MDGGGTILALTGQASEKLVLLCGPPENLSFDTDFHLFYNPDETDLYQYEDDSRSNQNVLRMTHQYTPTAFGRGVNRSSA